MNKDIKVIEVKFGDWGENYMGEVEWKYFNEWYGMKEKMDSMMSSVLWNSVVCGDGEEVDVKNIMSGVEFVRYGDYVIEVSGEEYDEFSYMYFNVDKMRGKIVELDEKSNGFKVVDDSGDDDKWEGMEMNGEKDEDMNEVVLCCGNRYKIGSGWF